MFNAVIYWNNESYYAQNSGILCSRRKQNSDFFVIEQLYNDGKAYLRDIVAGIENARESVDLEVFIMRSDQFGLVLLEALKKAAERGVRVRFVVDGLGSAPWLRLTEFNLDHDNIELRIFHPMPLMGYYLVSLVSTKTMIDGISKINRRNHKKLVIIDRRLVFLGSHNFWESSFYWKELGIRIDPCPERVIASFEYSWSRSKRHPTLKRIPNKKSWREQEHPPEQVQTSLTRKVRRLNLKWLCRQIDRAKHNVWLMTPYFSPPLRLMKALCAAGESGRDVSLILPLRSNHFFMKVVSRYYYYKLLRSNVVIYEYEPAMLHAKAIIIDNQSMLGSTNLNHRSFFHDLEIMVTLISDKAKQALKEEFLEAFRNSRRLDDIRTYRSPLWERFLHRILLTMKNWM